MNDYTINEYQAMEIIAIFGLSDLDMENANDAELIQAIMDVNEIEI